MIKLQVIKNTITPKLSDIQDKLAFVPYDAYQVFWRNTPKRTGNARRNTKLVKETIEANYDYAQRLDEGYSRQSPQGMTKPTEVFIKQTLNKIFKGR